MLRTLTQKFYSIAVLLLLLFGLIYVEMALFLNQQSRATQRGEAAVLIDQEIGGLERNLWEIYFWKRIILTEGSSEADQHFGELLIATKKKLSTFDLGPFAATMSERIALIRDLLNQDEESFNHLLQVRTEQRINRTMMASAYQAFASTILSSNEISLLKPLFNIAKFQEEYLLFHRDSEFQAIGVVLNSIQLRLSQAGLQNDRLSHYMNTYRFHLERDLSLEQNSRVIYARFDEISHQLTALFRDLSKEARGLSRSYIETTQKIRDDLNQSFLFSAGLGMLLLLGIIAVIARKIVHPIREMSNVVKEVQTGNLDARFAATDNADEIAQLGAAFNAMLDTVKENNRWLLSYQKDLESKVLELACSEVELRKHRNHLNELVEERTDELRQAVDQLQQEIRQRERAEHDLKEAKESAESANQAKSEFLANMSHEIRTPMNAIMALTDLALQTEMSTKQRSYLTIIDSSARSLLRLINDILDFSKIEAGKMDMEVISFQLQNLLEDLAAMFSDKTARKGIELIMDIDPNVPQTLSGDPLRLKQVLVNLVGNAVKFTERGEIAVRVTCVDRKDSRVKLLVSVTDTGIGIPLEDRVWLFSAFTQADGSTTRKYGGTGLGLAICKRLVEMMDGTIWVDSEPGKGSDFQFTVELGTASRLQDPCFLLPAEIRGLKVLVVDDNESARQVIADMLATFGFQVDMACSAEEAMARLDQSYGPSLAAEGIGLVVMDWPMSGIDGLSGCELIRRDSRWTDLPIILVTAFAREEQMRRAKAIGVNAFLPKPVKLSLLFDAVINVLVEQRDEPGRMPGHDASSESLDIHHFAGARILVVEDNPINQKVASELLTSLGIRVDTVGNGMEAIEAVSRSTYEAVLMDVQMPEMDGFEATRSIRAQLKMPDLPIIAMTAHAMKGDRELCLQAGMNDYVTKPIDLKQLFSVLGKWARVQEKNPATGLLTIRGVGAPGSEQEPSSLQPAINLEEALARLGGNKVLFDHLMNDFCDMFKNIAHDIQEAIRKGDHKLAGRLAHTLKGTAANLSANQLQEAAFNVEMALREGAVERIEPLLESVELNLRRVVKASKIMQGAPEGTSSSRHSANEGCPPDPAREREASTAELDHEELACLLNRLARFIRESDPVGAEECAETLKARLTGSELDDSVRRLVLHLQEFDFDTAQIALVQMADALRIPLSA